MIINNTNYWNTPVRNIVTRVELFNGSTLADVYNAFYKLKSFDVERVGENKFFGFGVCQKINIHLIDKNRETNITTENSLKPYLSTGGDLISSFPLFYVTEVHRDENTNELSITAYDAIYKASAHTVTEIGLQAPYTIKGVADAISAFLGLKGVSVINTDGLELLYPEGANFEGTETLREVLNAIAEATQSIYYIDKDEQLTFKRLDVSGMPVATIDKENYIELDSKTNRRLVEIVSATELGDNVSSTLAVSGSAQYVRNNPFWDMREDVAQLVDAALVAVGGLTINQFECNWRGNPQLEIGDKIALVAKDDSTVISFLLDDTISFDGGLSQHTQWSYTDNDNESANNPTSLGDALKRTFARVDKANKEIELVAGETAKIKLTTDAIQGSVVAIDNNIAGLVQEVNTKMSAEDVSIAIQQSLDDGIEKVTTTTGYTFNEQGLTISKSNSEITTTITEDGMTISKNNTEVLAANNQGVYAEDLHATTFLIIGNNSRLEDYNSSRTGCFWIGR